MIRLRKRIALAATALTLGTAITVPSVFAAHEHIVTSGETLSGIAVNNGTTVDALVAINGISDPHLIVPGQVVYLGGNEEHASSESGTVQGETLSYAETSSAETASSPSAQPWSSGNSNISAMPWWTDSVWSATPPAYDRAQISELLWDAAVRYGWDPYLIMAQAWQESYWSQDIVSWTGAVGVMQIMPATAGEMNQWYFGMELDQWTSVYDNIETGVAYLSVLYEETGSLELALASYYQGWGSLQRDGWFPDTEEYVSRILMFRDQFAAGQLP